MMSTICLLLILLTAPDPPPDAPSGASSDPAISVTLETIDGATIEAKLLSIESNGKVHYQRSDQDEWIALDDLSRLSVVSLDRTDREEARSNAELFFVGGGVLAARIIAPLDGDQGIRIETGLVGSMDVPFGSLLAIRLTARKHDAAETELVKRMDHRESGRDLLIAVRDEKPVVLPGALERITSEDWTFRIGDKSQTAPLDKAYAIVLSRTATAAPAAPVQVFLRDGGSLTGRIQSSDDRQLKFDAGSLGVIEIGWAKISSLVFQGGRVVELSAMEPASIQQRSLFDMAWPPRKNLNVTGGPMIMGGRRYERGVGVHAYTSMTFELGGAYEQFTAVAGIDDSVAPRGTAIFRVRCDDKIAFTSDLIGQGQSTTIKVDLIGVRKMTLECDPGEDLDISDHCNWASAKLIRAKDEKIR